MLMLQVHVVIERPLLASGGLRAVLPHGLKGRSCDGVLLIFLIALSAQLQDLRFPLQPDRDRLAVSAVGDPQDLNHRKISHSTW